MGSRANIGKSIHLLDSHGDFISCFFNFRLYTYFYPSKTQEYYACSIHVRTHIRVRALHNGMHAIIPANTHVAQRTLSE